MMDRPPTKKMIESLMDCHERELLGLEPCTVDTLKFVSGLIARGLIRTGSYTTKKGKEVLALYVTNKGRAYLSGL